MWLTEIDQTQFYYLPYRWTTLKSYKYIHICVGVNMYVYKFILVPPLEILCRGQVKPLTVTACLRMFETIVHQPFFVISNPGPIWKWMEYPGKENVMCDIEELFH